MRSSSCGSQRGGAAADPVLYNERSPVAAPIPSSLHSQRLPAVITAGRRQSVYRSGLGVDLNPIEML